jgi:beta-aspartyl-peptidase (threonine type)
VLLTGDGAEKFADEMKNNPRIQRVPNSYFDTEAARQEWLEERRQEATKAGPAKDPGPRPQPLPGESQSPATDAGKGTVGCVALDKHGNLAAGTSTGGLTNKKWGRIGDSPIIGAGTYANNATCAVSCTGIGEYFIKCSAAFHVSALMTYKGLSLDDAVRQIIEHVLPPDTGGIIAVDRRGIISMRLNTPGMFRAATDSTGRVVIELGK